MVGVQLWNFVFHACTRLLQFTHQYLCQMLTQKPVFGREFHWTTSVVFTFAAITQTNCTVTTDWLQFGRQIYAMTCLWISRCKKMIYVLTPIVHLSRHLLSIHPHLISRHGNMFRCHFKNSSYIHQYHLFVANWTSYLVRCAQCRAWRLLLVSFVGVRKTSFNVQSRKGCFARLPNLWENLLLKIKNVIFQDLCLIADQKCDLLGPMLDNGLAGPDVVGLFQYE